MGADAWSGIARHIGEATGAPFHPIGQRDVGGGCISSATILSNGKRDYFVKRNDPSRLDLFEAEADGLAALNRAGALRVPRPICWGSDGTGSYLVLERLDLRDAGAQGAEAGRRLAELHQYGLVDRMAFGWHRDNYIGATPQPNGELSDWVAFWRERRLGFQLELAVRNGHGRALEGPGDRLLAGLDALLHHRPSPSLLHGDLWGGNLGYLRDGTPVIFDPAVYRGDREADLSMTELFGGFGADFYAAYREQWPLDPGYATRKILYNLYHVLNHLNLFGTGYLGQAKSMMGRLLSELG